jgi:hypothetical protein
MMFFNPFTDPVTDARINFRVMNTNTPAAMAPAIGNPTSETKVKKFIIICVYLPDILLDLKTGCIIQISIRNMFKIYTDQRPYFITFQLDNLLEIKSFVNKCLETVNSDPRVVSAYRHLNLTETDGRTVIEMFPASKIYKFAVERVAVFETPPYGGAGIHKDGPLLQDNNARIYGPHNVSFNIPIEVSDNKCVTRWYDDDQFINFENKSDGKYSRNVFLDYANTDKFKASAETILPNSCAMLVNTEKWHTFYNDGPNIRRILTLRLSKEERSKIDFLSVAETLFKS